jgi:hypothetical protein
MLANEAVSKLHPAFVTDASVTIPNAIERPLKAFVAIEGKNNMLQEMLHISVGGTASERIAVSPPAQIVRVAPSANTASSPMGIAVAARDRAWNERDSHC